jgi:hypothetical protein
MDTTIAMMLTLASGTTCYANESDNVPDTSQWVVANDLTCTAKRDAYIRLVPDGDSIGTIHKGDVFAPIKVKGDWIHTQVNRSLHGWISNKILDCRWTPNPSLDAEMKAQRPDCK